MAKLLFFKFPSELKREMILLSGRRMLALSSLLRDTSEVITRHLIKESEFTGSTFNADDDNTHQRYFDELSFLI